MKALRVILIFGLLVVCFGPWILAAALIIALAKALHKAD